VVHLSDAAIPAQTMVFPLDLLPEIRALHTAALGHAWDFPDAQTSLPLFTSAVVVMDLMSSPLPAHERIDLFQRFLRAVLAAWPCQAIYWVASERLTPAQTWTRHFDTGTEAHRFLGGAVNVRLFRVEGAAADRRGDLVMDTLGLHAFGLPDLQCHFQGLPESEMAIHLYDLAWYLFSQGDVIADGNTVEGLLPASRWVCRRDDALVGPERLVLDIHPGNSHAAGPRAG
jgi:hypothetical protein